MDGLLQADCPAGRPPVLPSLALLASAGSLGLESASSKAISKAGSCVLSIDPEGPGRNPAAKPRSPLGRMLADSSSSCGGSSCGEGCSAGKRESADGECGVCLESQEQVAIRGCSHRWGQPGSNALDAAGDCCTSRSVGQGCW